MSTTVSPEELYVSTLLQKMVNPETAGAGKENLHTADGKPLLTTRARFAAERVEFVVENS